MTTDGGSSPALDRLRAEINDKLSVAFFTAGHTSKVHQQIVLKQCEDYLVELFQTTVRELVPVPPDLHELLRAFACKQLGINRDVSDTVLLKEINGRGVATDAQDTTAGIPSTQPPDAGSRVTPDTEGPPRKDEASLPLGLHLNKDLQEEPWN